MKEESRKIKDKWDKADVVLRSLGGVLTALAVASVGFFGSQYLEGRQAEETNLRLYAQLMSGREKSYSELRKDMFNAIIGVFFKTAPSTQERDLEEEVLALELLAYNFNDIIDLGPLFKHVERKVSTLKEKGLVTETDLQLSQRKVEQDALEKRLQGVASEVVDKQLLALNADGVVYSSSVVFHELKESPGGILLVSDKLRLDTRGNEEAGFEKERFFQLEALDYDLERKELHVRLIVMEVDSKEVVVDAPFWVGFFDFPMIDNTRLPDGGRAAVVLRHWYEDQVAEVALVYFPESRVGQKETPYYDEVLDELMHTGKKLRQVK